MAWIKNYLFKKVQDFVCFVYAMEYEKYIEKILLTDTQIQCNCLPFEDCKMCESRLLFISKLKIEKKHQVKNKVKIKSLI